MTTLRQSGLVTLLLSTLLLHGCGSDSNETPPQPVAPQLNVGADITLKERRSATLTAAGSSGTFNWKQVSGPDLLLTSTNTATVNIQAPSVSTDSNAILQVSLTNADNQTISKQVTVFIKNNQPPKISVNFKPYQEKTSGSFTVEATDPDGTIKSYEWKQHRGPDLKMTGTDTATVHYTVPAVSAPYQFVTISVLVTDDDGEGARYIYDRPIEQNMREFKLTGRLTDAALAGATVVAHARHAPIVTKADSNGVFNLTVSADDDETNLLMLLEAIKADNNKLSYYTLIPDLGSRKATEPVLINAFSTAWYAALVGANHGKSPASLTELRDAESSAIVEKMTEQAAVATLLMAGQSTLPDASSLHKVLTDQQVYLTVLDDLQANKPGLIATTETALLADPQQTPSAEQWPALTRPLYEVEAVIKGFSAPGSRSYQLADNGTGQYLDLGRAKAFQWQQQHNVMTVTWPDFRYESFESVQAGLMGLSAELAEQLRRWNYTSLPITNTYQHSTLQLLATGVDGSIFRVTDTVLQQMRPFSFFDQRIAPPDQQVTKSRIVRIVQTPEQPQPFVAAELNTDWSVSRYLPKAYTDFQNFYRDRFSFNPDGTGRSHNQSQSFRWQINADGALHIIFADNSAMQLHKIRQLGEIWQVYQRHFAADGTVQLGTMHSAFAINLSGEADKLILNAPQHYWQEMNALRSPQTWTGNKIRLQAADGTVNAQGYQISADHTGYFVRADTSKLPVFSPLLKHKHRWLLRSDNIGSVITAEGNVFCSPEAFCYQREWRLLKTTQGLIGKRLYLEEIARSRFDPQDPLRYLSGPSLMIYEEVPYNYFNQPE